ncbi:MAG: peptidoglycan DD-metalloendopeptidase family protein, partial [Parvibaculaceae bacterium]|nr:peptidoglycan DD-metalloendopeptidase family protein [Parvibaculaceae bacterium]
MHQRPHHTPPQLGRIRRNIRDGSIVVALLMGGTSIAMTAGFADPAFSAPEIILSAPENGADPSRLKAIEQELIDHQARERLLREQAAKLSAEVLALKKQLVSAAAKVQKREGDVIASEDRLDGLVAAQAVLSAKLKTRQKDMTETLAALQRLDRNPPPALAIQPDDTVAAMRSAMLLSTLVPQLEAEANELRARIEELRLLRASILSERTVLQSANVGLSKERQKLERLLVAKQIAETKAKSQAAKEAREVARLSKEATTLGDLIAKLEARAAARLPVSRPAVLPNSGKKAVGEKKNTQIASLPPLFGGQIHRFSQARGQLSFPARGHLVRKYGARGKNGTKTQGITLETRPLAQITSPFDGEIAFAGPFRQYGQLLILKVGEGYHLLLAGMAQIDGSVGQKVLAGEPIGLMPKKPAESARKGAASQRPALYIE